MPYIFIRFSGIGNGSPEYAAYTKQAGYFTSASDCGCLTFWGAVIHLVCICSGRGVRDSYGYDSLEKGIAKGINKPSGGGKFTSIKVIRILRDSFYFGRLEDGSISPQLESLRLRSDDTYDQILYILEQSRISEAETKLMELRKEAQKKMIACHLFKRIEVGRDYKISVELNMSYQQLCSEWGGGSILATEAI